jgi:hypothetical protein
MVTVLSCAALYIKSKVESAQKQGAILLNEEPQSHYLRRCTFQYDKTTA